MRSQAEVQDMASEAAVAANEGSKFSGMSYEQGVEEALRWVLQETDEHPLGDDQ